MTQGSIFSRILLVMTMLAVSGPVLAVNPDEMLDDPALEARARHISADLRCLVCQNQSIDESDAPLAKDLRILVRERIKEGDTDEEAVAFLVDRYGEFVLLKPTFTTKNIILWAFAPLILIFGLFAIHRLYRKNKQVEAIRQRSGVDHLSAEEQARLDDIMQGDGKS